MSESMMVPRGGHVQGSLSNSANLILRRGALVHVPYRGGAPALTDLLGGQVELMFTAMSSSIEHIRSGRLCALAVTTTTRSALPDLPTVGDFVPVSQIAKETELTRQTIYRIQNHPAAAEAALAGWGL
jgi:tripartite-type tricarboxylate transporter receptor subunit TctC